MGISTAEIVTWAILAVVGYLLGCANGAILTSKIFYRDDVRKHGSGNAGLTNFYRTYGSKLILCVIAVDMLKAVIAVELGGAILGGPALISDASAKAIFDVAANAKIVVK